MATENDQTIPNAEPEESKSVSLVRLEIEPPDSYFYSNVAGSSITPWDIRINFADVSPTANDEQQRYKAVVGVTLPPDHAAGLCLLLMQQVQAYEKQFGEVKHPRWRALRLAAHKGDKDIPEAPLPTKGD